MPSTTIAFIGTGIMGLPTARNFLRAGFAVRAHNRTRTRAEPPVAERATLAGAPAAAYGISFTRSAKGASGGRPFSGRSMYQYACAQ